MTAAGWYPDPSGTPSSFRYWDGQAWTQHTSGSPTGQSPPSAPPPPAPPAPPATPPTRPPSGPPPVPPTRAAPSTPPPSQAPPTQAPPTQAPPTQAPPTQAPPTQAPPTQAPGQPPAYAPAGGYGQGGAGWATGGADAGYGAPPTGSQASGNGARIALVVGAVVAVLALAVGTFFTVRAVTGDDTTTADDETSQSSEPSESDEPTDELTDEPTDEPTEPDSSDPSPSASIPVEPTGRECVGGQPEGGQPPSGGSLSGGGLALGLPSGFNPLALEAAFVFADGVATVARQIEPEWVALYALGSITKANGFSTPEQAADVVLTCMTESDLFYRGFTGRTDLESSPVTIAGAEAWVLTSEVRVEDPKVTVEGDVAKVIVVDTGDPTSYGLFVSVVPIGDQALIDQQDQAVAGLTLN